MFFMITMSVHQMYIFFVETNLTRNHCNEEFTMSESQLHRNGNSEGLSFKAVYGTAIYNKQHITYRTVNSNCDNIEITVAILDELIQNLHLVSINIS